MRTMRMLMRVLVRMNRPVGVSMFMLLWANLLVLMLMVLDLRVAQRSMFVAMRIAALDDNVNLGSGDAAANDLMHFETRAHVQGRGSFLHQRGRHTRVDQSAEQHVSTDARKAVQISDSHSENCKRPARQGPSAK